MISKVSLFILASIFGASSAFAIMPKAKVYMLMDDGGEHPVEKCAVVAKAPAKLKKQKIFAKVTGYLGTVQTEFASKNEAGIDMYEHYFSNEADCAAAIKTLNN